MNWAARLLRATKQKRFTEKEIKLAYDWNSCAVGETSEFVPLPGSRLYRLGMKFCRAVGNHKVDEACKLYLEIKAKR